VHFYVSSQLVRISHSLIVSAGLLALIICTGCGSSSFSHPQTPLSVADVAARAVTSPSTPPVLLFVGTGTSSPDVAAVKTILGNLKLTYATATSSQLNAMSESSLKAYKLLLIPGGNAITISQNLNSSTITNVHNAIVNDGVHYLGICAGGFFADNAGIYDYLKLTGNVWFDYYEDEYDGIHKNAVEITAPNGSQLDQYWENGPQLSGWGQIVGKYPDGTPAITEGYSGKGWVILSGVHPEAPDSWRSGMHFTTSAAVDNAYAATLVTAALNGTSLPHF
jgi:biotin protein ligase-like protein